jgi:hypothetical protein
MARRKRNENRRSAENWASLIRYCEANLERIEIRAAQVRDMIGVFRGHLAAGDACPLDLIDAISEGNRPKMADS